VDSEIGEPSQEIFGHSVSPVQIAGHGPGILGRQVGSPHFESGIASQMMKQRTKTKTAFQGSNLEIRFAIAGWGLLSARCGGSREKGHGIESHLLRDYSQ
jgi:hypothetical protein